MGHWHITCMVVAAVLVIYTAGAAEVAVDTKFGSVIGTSAPTDGVDSFLGIQYATVGTRFSRSTPTTKSLRGGQTIDATQYGPECHQPDSSEEQDEECLYLNIWRPSGIDEGGKLSTMVWLHGGSFQGGSAYGPWYSGEVLAKEQNVIVVSINYRLGILGFLPNSIDGSGGMNGILDQINALKWVKEHIMAFGGNPDDVTIFGESAGSYSVCVLSVSPLAKGLFRRAIMESLACSHGPIPGATYPYDPLTGYALVTLPLLHAFRGSADAILNASPEFLTEHNTMAVWPTVDGHVIPRGTSPGELYKDRSNINPVDMIVGSTKHDDASIGAPPEQYMAMADLAAGVFTMLASFPDYNAAGAIIEAYDEAYRANPIAAYAEFIGDLTVRCPSREFASAVAPQLEGNMYLYNYAHFSIADGASISGLVEAAGIQDDTFASHGSEVLFVFGTYDLVLQFLGLDDGGISATQEDVDLSREMMTRWANFAKTGDPNGDGLEEWTAVPQSDDGGTAGRATNASTLLLTGGGGVMHYPEEQVDQCSTFPHLDYWR